MMTGNAKGDRGEYEPRAPGPIDWAGKDPRTENGAEAPFAPDGSPSSTFRAAQAERTDKARAWDIWTPDRIYAPLPTLEWAIEGVAVKGSLGLICAYGSSLKTWAELDLLEAVATSRKWLGRFACASGRVFLVDYESGHYEIRRRLQAIARGRSERGAPLALVEGISFVTMPPSFLPDDDFIARLEPIAAVSALVAIDTLAAGSPGVDENATTFALPLQRLKALAERTGCTIIALHHNRKSKEGEDDREATRGTSAVYNALDWELKLFRVADDEKSFVCKQTKQRNGKAAEPFLIRVDDVDAGACVVRATDAAPSKLKNASAQYAATCKSVMDAARKHPDMPGKSLVARVAGTDKVKWAAIEELVELGRLVNMGTEKRPRYRPRPGNDAPIDATCPIAAETLRDTSSVAANTEPQTGESLRSGSQRNGVEKAGVP